MWKVHIASIFGIVTGVLVIYKWFSTGKDDNCPELQPVHHELYLTVYTASIQMKS